MKRTGTYLSDLFGICEVDWALAFVVALVESCVFVLQEFLEALRKTVL